MPVATKSSPDDAGYFSADYATARERFRDAARRAGGALSALPIDAHGPGGTTLTIDIAWLGSEQPSRALLHTSGLHGVEAFAGSAVQLHLLEQAPAMPAERALILVHVLNPYGMAWLRRVNENNVDLNRNFLGEGETWSGAPATYRAIDHFLNPASPPGFDFFRLRAAWHALRHGFLPLQQAVAQGQYEFPHGLFFGGRQLQQGPRVFQDWLRQNLAGTRYLFALDVHTGLGRWGSETLIAEPGVCATPHAALCAVLNKAQISSSHPDSTTYAVRGGMGGILPRILPATQIDFLLQELGTYPPISVFHALREENRLHHHGRGDENLQHPVKLRLREALCPAAPGWRRQAVGLGTAFAHAAADWALRHNNQLSR